MSSSVPLSLENDISAGLLTHRAFGPTCPVPTEMPSIEMLAPMKSLLGTLLGKNKLTSTVSLNDLWFALDGHDCGPGIQDITPGCPVNVFAPAMYCTSSRKVIYTAARVQADKLPIALTSLSLKLMSCGEPLSLPVAPSLSNFLNDCVVGPDLSDLVAGAASIVSSIVVDKVSASFAGRFFPAAPPGTVSFERFQVQTVVRDALSRSVGTYDAAGITKAVVGGLAEGAISYARGRANGTGDWSIRFALGGPLGGVEVSYARRGRDSAGTHAVQVASGPLQQTCSSDPNGVRTTEGQWIGSRVDALSTAPNQGKPGATATPPLNPRPAPPALTPRPENLGANR